MKNMKNTWSSIALLLAGGIVLGATVFRAPIAYAAQQVNAIIIGPADANGSVMVHDTEADHEPWHLFLGASDQYTVPDGKRLVIEYANGIAQLVQYGQPDWTLSIVESGGGGQGYHFAGRSLVNCDNCYVMSEHLRLYAPAGSVVKVGVVPVGSELRLSGYLIDIP